MNQYTTKNVTHSNATAAWTASVSVFPNCFATDGTLQRASLATLLAAVQDGVHRAAVESLRRHLRTGRRQAYDHQKHQLQAATYGGTFRERCLDGLETATGLCLLEIDFHPKDPAALPAAEALRDAFAKDPLIAIALVSPSGAGVRVAFRIPVVTSDAAYKHHWAPIARYLRISYNQTVDESGADVCRLWFATWDPGVHRNPAALVFPGYQLARRFHALAQHLWRMQDGSRDATRNKVAHTLGGLIAGGHVTADYALAYFRPIVVATTRDPERQWRKFQVQLARGTRRPLRHETPQAAPAHQASHPQQHKQALPYSDYTNALAFVRDHGAGLRYCFAWKTWLVWTGTHWQRDTQGTVMRLAKQTIKRLAQHLPALDDPQAKALLTHIKKSLGTSALKAMVENAQSEPGIPVQPEDLDQHPWVLNCCNGRLDLRTGVLLPHAPEDLLTQCLTVAYDPDAVCPTWDRFLARILADNQNLIGFLQRAIGYALTGVVSHHVLPLLWGTGRNGKSTLLNTLLALFGPYGMKAPSELLMVSKNDRHPTERADLFGKRFVAAIETEQGRRLAEVFVKEATGSDPIRARRMHENFWEFWPTHKVFLATNHKPIITGTDAAIWERIRLVPFSVTIPREERDTSLPDKLQAELPGILTWAIRGCLDWQKTGLGEPDEVQHATDGYRAEMDVLGQFIVECCVVGPNYRTKADKLYDRYTRWHGDQAQNQRAWGMALTERGFERKRGTGGSYWWLGIGLVETHISESNTSDKEAGVNQVNHSEPRKCLGSLAEPRVGVAPVNHSEPSEPKNHLFSAEISRIGKTPKLGSLGSLGSLPSLAFGDPCPTPECGGTIRINKAGVLGCSTCQRDADA